MLNYIDENSNKILITNYEVADDVILVYYTNGEVKTLKKTLENEKFLNNVMASQITDIKEYCENKKNEFIKKRKKIILPFLPIFIIVAASLMFPPNIVIDIVAGLGVCGCMGVVYAFTSSCLKELEQYKLSKREIEKFEFYLENKEQLCLAKDDLTKSHELCSCSVEKNISINLADKMTLEELRDLLISSQNMVDSSEIKKEDFNKQKTIGTMPGSNI